MCENPHFCQFPVGLYISVFGRFDAPGDSQRDNVFCDFDGAGRFLGGMTNV